VSWFLAFAGFAVLIILHELGHFAVAKWVGMRVERFSLFFPPHIWKKTKGETEYAIGVLPFGGYVKISGMNPDEHLPDEVRTRAYWSQPVWKRIAVISAGPLVNVIIAFLLLLAFATAIGPRDISDRVGQVEPGFPAAGKLKPGDRIVAVDGKPGDVVAFSKRIASHKCAGKPREGCRATKPATVTVERGGRRLTFTLTPIYDPIAKRTRVGFGYSQPRDKLGLGEAFDFTTDRFWFITRETVKLPLYVIDAEKRKDISGLVGSYETTRQVVKNDIGDAVGILAIISLSLAIINLFPFLPLDGGHIFWAIVEKIRRKPISYALMERAGVLGFMLVIGLFLLGLTNDIDRLRGEGFNPR
jgi:regulator of sigma E protease